MNPDELELFTAALRYAAAIRKSGRGMNLRATNESRATAILELEAAGKALIEAAKRIT